MQGPSAHFYSCSEHNFHKRTQKPDTEPSLSVQNCPFAMHTPGEGQRFTDVQEDYSDTTCFAWW